MSAMRSETRSKIGLWLAQVVRVRRCSATAISIRYYVGPPKAIGPRLLQEPGTYRGGGSGDDPSRYQEKARLHVQPHTLTGATPEPTEFGPRPLTPRPVPASFQLTACERCPSLLPLEGKLFVRHLNPNGKTDDGHSHHYHYTTTTTTPPRPAPEILPEMTPCRASRHLMRTSLPPSPPCPPSPPPILFLLLLDP